MANEKLFMKNLYKYSIIPQIILIAVLFYMYSIYVQPLAIALLYAFISFCIIVLILRNSIPWNHKRGISYLKKKDYANAISQFEKSYEFFSSHKWIDNYRFIVLFSSSKVSYTEMALLNLGFCSAQLGRIDKAREYYQTAVKLFHGSELAEKSLESIRLIEKANEEKAERKKKSK